MICLMCKRDMPYRRRDCICNECRPALADAQAWADAPPGYPARRAALEHLGRQPLSARALRLARQRIRSAAAVHAARRCLGRDAQA